jgi:hypothetical protein
MSTRRGRGACVSGLEEDEGEGEERHCKKSYTSSLMIKASCWRANSTSWVRRRNDMVLPDGLEKVGTQ